MIWSTGILGQNPGLLSARRSLHKFRNLPECELRRNTIDAWTNPGLLG